MRQVDVMDPMVRTGRFSGKRRPDAGQGQGNMLALKTLLQHASISRGIPSFSDRRLASDAPADECRLAAVLAADVVGYTRLMSVNEGRTHRRYKAHRRELIDPTIAKHRGRIVKSTGDGVLVEFTNAQDAMACAIEIQRSMAERNDAEPHEERIVFRIGINHGRIIVESDDIYGDEVNIAVRLQMVAPPGGIAVSAKVAAMTKYIVDMPFEDIGPKQFKDMCRPIHTFQYQCRDCRW